MIDKTKKTLQRLQNTVTNISSSFNIKIKQKYSKNQKNSENTPKPKKDNIDNNSSSPLTINTMDINNALTRTKQQEQLLF